MRSSSLKAILLLHENRKRRANQAMQRAVEMENVALKKANEHAQARADAKKKRDAVWQNLSHSIRRDQLLQVKRIEAIANMEMLKQAFERDEAVLVAQEAAKEKRQAQLAVAKAHRSYEKTNWLISREKRLKQIYSQNQEIMEIEEGIYASK